MRIIALALALCACTSNDHTVGVNALAGTTVRLGFYPPDGDGSGYVDIPLAPEASGCSVLDAAATYAGHSEALDGGGTVETNDGGHGCADAGVQIATFHPSMDPAATFELDIADDRDTARMVVVGPYAPRTITVEGGMLVSGAAAHLHWSPASDVLAPVLTGQVYGIACYPSPITNVITTPLVLAVSTVSGPYETAMTVAGPDFSFVMPAVTYHGPVRCFADVSATAAVSTCTGFAACNTPLLLPPPTGVLPPEVLSDALMFDTTM